MKHENTRPIRMNWLFDVEPYARSQTETFVDVRADMRLKKILKRAVERDVAPHALIESIRAGIRS